MESVFSFGEATTDKLGKGLPHVMDPDPTPNCKGTCNTTPMGTIIDARAYIITCDVNDCGHERSSSLDRIGVIDHGNHSVVSKTTKT